jgi:metal transporter CNNM
LYCYIEAVIKDEIVDETDNFVEVNKTETTVVRGRGASHRPDPTNFLTLFEHKVGGCTN